MFHLFIYQQFLNAICFFKLLLLQHLKKIYGLGDTIDKLFVLSCLYLFNRSVHFLFGGVVKKKEEFCGWQN